jgi:hypothetical protein
MPLCGAVLICFSWENLEDHIAKGAVFSHIYRNTQLLRLTCRGRFHRLVIHSGIMVLFVCFDYVFFPGNARIRMSDVQKKSDALTTHVARDKYRC